MIEQQITHWNITTIPERELLARRARVLREMEEKKADAMLFFSASALQYLTGAGFIETERPFVFILKADGSNVMLVPFLEAEHVPIAAKGIDTLEVYREYPGEVHPMRVLSKLLTRLGLSDTTLLTDSDGYGLHFGYTGPKISSLLPRAKLLLRPDLIPQLKQIKSPYDQQVIREVTRWCHLAHALLQEYTRPGLKELDVVNQVRAEATRAMLLTLGPDFQPGSDIQAGADFRGQIGKATYYPHALCNNATFQAGDILGTRARANFFGYGSELERSLFLGEPSAQQQYYYRHVLALQDLAFHTIRPGIRCSDVDRELLRYYRENGLMEYWRHHTGHGLGLGKHEAPFLDEHDDTVIQPGMVFSVEPGLYVKGLGGFRISDSVLVTENGIELLTYYPRSLEQVTIL